MCFMNTPHGFIEKLAELAASDRPFVAVTLVEAVGSTPQDAGSKMLVDKDGLVFGTVGGGRIEHQAIEHATNMLAAATSQNSSTELVEWNLQRDVGMTCGGVVKLYFEAFNHGLWQLVIFGAGHVAELSLAAWKHWTAGSGVSIRDRSGLIAFRTRLSSPSCAPMI